MNRKRAFGAWLLIGGLLVAATSDAPNEFADETLRLDLPKGWTLEGADGEYRLESDGDEAEVGSLLLLAPDAERSLEERLADIEAQFVSTGLIRLDKSEMRSEDGTPLHYRRYRLTPAGSVDEEGGDVLVMLHQYSFRRAGIQVLLQVEAAPGRMVQEDLAFRIFHTLEVRKAPDPFRWRGAPDSTGASGPDAR